MGKRNVYLLIYDDSCAFCTFLAVWLKGLDPSCIFICPCSAGGDPIYGEFPDSFYRNVRVILIGDSVYNNVEYVGAGAAAEILSVRYPFVKKLYWTPVFKQIADAIYFIIKKTRKYISIFF